MTNPFGGIRGQVTVMVLAVTACLYSLLGAVGFIRVAGSGRTAIRERVTQVVDQLESSLRAGSTTVRIVTPDGVEATASSPTAVAVSSPAGDIVVDRSITVDNAPLRLVGHASQARLSQSLRSLWRGLWIGVPLAAIISALMAGLATARALRPVHTIARLADTIGAHDTDTRVPTPDTGDEIEHLARTVNRMLDRIAAGRRAQRQFSSDAAHELRTPLMALQGEIELATSNVSRVDLALLERLDALAQRLGARVDDLVLLSTLDEQPPLARREASLLDIARAEASAVAGEIDVRGDDAITLCDRALISRAVRNLMTNAQRHARSVVQVTVARDSDRVWVHVDDDGHGITIDERHRVFDRFARLDQARTVDGGGAGLGLSIVAAVAASHHGGVAADDSPLGGARVSLWLPLDTDHPDTQERHTPARSTSTRIPASEQTDSHPNAPTAITT